MSRFVTIPHIANSIAAASLHSPATRAIAEDLVRLAAPIVEDLVRLAAPFDTPLRRAIVEDARRAAFRSADDPGVIPRFVA